MENKFTELCQVGIVVRDREPLIQNMRDVFGVEPYLITRTAVDENSTYYNEQADYAKGRFSRGKKYAQQTDVGVW